MKNSFPLMVLFSDPAGADICLEYIKVRSWDFKGKRVKRLK